MNNSLLTGITLTLALFISACASTPEFDTTGLNLDITPDQAINQSRELKGVGVLWGGILINSTNLKDETQFEILAYPLSSDQRPNIDSPPMGRFLAVKKGYMEISSYAQGRLVTVSGVFEENRMGRVGETEYTYPTVQINKIHLWRSRTESRSRTQFRIGIGVIFHD